MKRVLAAVIVIGLTLVGIGYYAATTAVEPAANREVVDLDAASLHTAKIERGDLSRTIKAEGTVKLEQVEVGAQVTGRIDSFGTDPEAPQKPLDCGSRVRKGMVLARIDPMIYKAQVDCSEAAVLKAKANLLQSQARRDQTEQEWKRAESLRVLNAISDADHDVALTNFRTAAANVAVWEADVQQTEASLRIAKANLDYTIIRSPCDGVILDRRVSVGQTVVASFNAPGLFLIAKDSRQMQIWAPVNEAEIGYIHPGLPVRFTVSACFDRAFDGRVTQIRSSPTKRAKSITYTVVVAADHFDELLPDMTAKLQFEIERRANVLLIPNAALQRSASESSAILTTAGLAPPTDELVDPSEELSRIRTAARFNKQRRVNRCLWVRDGALLRPIEVQAGASNGRLTEIVGTGVREGMEVVWGEVCMQDCR